MIPEPARYVGWSERVVNMPWDCKDAWKFDARPDMATSRSFEKVRIELQ